MFPVSVIGPVKELVISTVTVLRLVGDRASYITEPGYSYKAEAEEDADKCSV